MSEINRTRVPGLAWYGAALLRNGYPIIPITPPDYRVPRDAEDAQALKGLGKRPSISNWQNLRTTPEILQTWLANGRSENGVGILTAYCPAIDLDIYDEVICEQLSLIVDRIAGEAPVRQGLAPKRLHLFRASRPFNKITSASFQVPGTTRPSRVEILGDGQQFVAFGEHPETRSPYSWPTGEHPVNLPWRDLPELTLDQGRQVVQAFEQLARAQGWSELASGSQEYSGGASSAGAIDALDIKLPLSDFDLDDARELLYSPPLLELANASNDIWVRVGQALHHQFEGGYDAFLLWDEWSEQGASYEGEGATEKRWASFGKNNQLARAVTIRSYQKLYRDWVKAQQQQEQQQRRDNENFIFNNLQKAVSNFTGDWIGFKESEIPGKARNFLANVEDTGERDRYLAKFAALIRAQKLEFLPPRTDALIKELRPTRAALQVVGEHQSLKDLWGKYVYVTENDKFFDTETGIGYSTRSFNAIFNARVKTAEDSRNADALATDVLSLPVAIGARYMPGMPSTFCDDEGLVYTNTWRDVGAIAPSAITPSGQQAIEGLKAHLAAIFERPEDAELLLDYLAFCVQHPGVKINWAFVIWGHRGIGKTLLAEMMRAVLGSRNVKPLDASILKTSFTDWATNRQLTFVEEIRIDGRERFELLNRIKTFMTNETISINPKGEKPYETANVTNYVLFTNHTDALPVDEEENRYYPAYTRFKTGEAAKEYRLKWLDFYTWLYDALKVEAGSVKLWFKQREIKNFLAFGRAPENIGILQMAEETRSPRTATLEDVILEGPEVIGANHELLSVAWVSANWPFDDDKPVKSQWGSVMRHAGYTRVKILDTVRDQVKINGVAHIFYSKSEKWLHGVTAEGVRQAVAKVFSS